MSLPYAADAETSLSPSELQVLKSQYESELAAGHVTTQTKFNYAWGLVKSKQRADMSIGVGLLTGEYLLAPSFLTLSLLTTATMRNAER